MRLVFLLLSLASLSSARVSYVNHPYDEGRPLADDETLQPIRFHALAVGDGAVDNTGFPILQGYVDNVISPALAIWSTSLSVVPVSEPLTVSTAHLFGRETCGAAPVPEFHISEGIDKTDFIVYVTNDCTVGSVAEACDYDQFGRPIAGSIRFCTTEHRGPDAAGRWIVSNREISRALHSIGRILGHWFHSFRFFRDPNTGLPRSVSSQFTYHQCPDGSMKQLLLPDTNTLTLTEGSNGEQSATLVTPTVRTVVRNQFDCPSLMGAQLERIVDVCSRIGDRWNRRYFLDDIMSSEEGGGHITPLTLALFEDSGWYKANWTVARGSSWGLGAGCDFVDGPCLIPSSPSPAESEAPEVPDYALGFFCSTNSSGPKCSSDLTHKGKCTIEDYAVAADNTATPPPSFQYFSGKATLGGPSQIDYCPIVSSNGLPLETLDCTTSKNSPQYNIYSEAYGENSRCFESESTSHCYRVACIQDVMQVAFNVRGEWLTCEYDFQQHEVRVGPGLIALIITCPRFSQVCPELFGCPHSCRGRGVCSRSLARISSCECFNSLDTSPSCSESPVLGATELPVSRTLAPTHSTASPTAPVLSPTSSALESKAELGSSMAALLRFLSLAGHIFY